MLQQVLALLEKDASIKVEVQGHTDNVGTDAYNQTLSDSRAAAVVGWLTQHGIAAARLTSKGYGKTKPVADNGSDLGRARNRRVEIADPAACRGASRLHVSAGVSASPVPINRTLSLTTPRSRSTLLHQRGSALADSLKRHFEATKFFRTQYREHSPHPTGMLSKG